MTGVILAGGRSNRMGQDKAFLPLLNRPLVGWVNDLFTRLFSEVILVTNEPLKYLSLKAHIVTDIFPGKGALGGIFTGLVIASHRYCFVAACDMPFLKEKSIRLLMEQTQGYDVVVPVSQEGLEPLHAIYSKNCLKPIREQLRRDNFKIIDFFPKVRVKEVPFAEMASGEEEVSPLFNVNTPAELEQAQRLAGLVKSAKDSS